MEKSVFRIEIWLGKNGEGEIVVVLPQRPFPASFRKKRVNPISPPPPRIFSWAFTALVLEHPKSTQNQPEERVQERNGPVNHCQLSSLVCMVLDIQIEAVEADVHSVSS